MPKMSPVYLPAVPLTDEIVVAAKEGEFPLRIGQWVVAEDHDSKRPIHGQFVGYDRHGNLTICWVRNNENFDHRTQRFARAVWHRRDKRAIGPVNAVLRAPRTLSLDAMKQAFTRVWPRMAA